MTGKEEEARQEGPSSSSSPSSPAPPPHRDLEALRRRRDALKAELEQALAEEVRF